jgi:hypothetical protein
MQTCDCLWGVSLARIALKIFLRSRLRAFARFASSRDTSQTRAVFFVPRRDDDDDGKPKEE